MKSEDKNKDFIDKFFELINPYKSSGIRLVAVMVCFAIFFLLGIFIAPFMIKEVLNVLLFGVDLLQISPFEILYNYIKIGFFFSVFCTLPFFIYQFGKLKYEAPEFKEKMDLLIASLVFALISVASFFISYKIIFPLNIMFLYGLNFNVSTFTASLSSMTAFFITTFLICIMLLLLPFLRYIIKKSLFFNYATFVKYKKIVMIYLAILSGIIFLPIEYICIGLTFLIFFIWYKILVRFSKKRD